MNLNNPKGVKETQSNRNKKTSMHIFTISSDWRAKEHPGETIFIEWNLSTPKSMFFYG
jgi:hypothetical protein